MLGSADMIPGCLSRVFGVNLDQERPTHSRRETIDTKVDACKSKYVKGYGERANEAGNIQAE